MIKPTAVAKYATVREKIGANTNGIIKLILKTIGKPKMIGSLILNSAGVTDNFAKSL